MLTNSVRHHRMKFQSMTDHIYEDGSLRYMAYCHHSHLSLPEYNLLFAQWCHHLMVHFSECIPVVKQHVTVAKAEFELESHISYARSMIPQWSKGRGFQWLRGHSGQITDLGDFSCVPLCTWVLGQGVPAPIPCLRWDRDDRLQRINSHLSSSPWQANLSSKHFISSCQAAASADRRVGWGRDRWEPAEWL
jgi:hypothetical protein